MEFFNFFRHFWMTGFFPIMGFLFTSFYLRGMYVNHKIVAQEKVEGFEIAKYDFRLSLQFFKFMNMLFDSIIGCIVALFVKEDNKFLSDETIETAFSKIYKDKTDIKSLSIQSRIAFAQREFDAKSNLFWWHRERAIDYRNVPPIFSDRFFNHEPIEKYLPFLLSPKTFYRAVRAGLIAVVVSFVCVSAIYHPSKLYSYKSDVRLAGYMESLSNNKAAWASSVPTEERINQSYDRVMEVQGEPINAINWLLNVDGIVEKMLLSIGIGLVFASRLFKSSLKHMKLGFVRDMPAEYLHNNLKERIDSEKTSLAASNLKACGHDRVAPIMVSFYSTGDQEAKGKIGAMRKADPIFQSLLDKTQNTIVFGSIGTGKTLTVLKPEAIRFLQLKSMFWRYEQEYDALFEKKRECLTSKAIYDGFLDKFMPLPYNPISVGMLLIDIKCQLWKEISPIAEKMKMKELFFVIGTEEQDGEHAIDPLTYLVPTKLIAVFKAMGIQMGDKIDGNFWNKYGLDITLHYLQLIYVFQRTTRGRELMKERNMKIWSLAFILEVIVYDHDQSLFDEMIDSIYMDLKDFPERLSDIFTVETVRALKFFEGEWKIMAEDQKSGLKSTISSILSNYNNSKLGAFMTGVGDDIVDIKEMFGKLAAVNLDTDKYGNPGKMLTLCIKTLVMEEAIKRQIRYSARTLQIIGEFRKAYPNLFEAKAAPELIDYSAVDNHTQKLVGLFIDTCEEIQAVVGGDFAWKKGQYVYELESLKKKLEVDALGVGEMIDQAMDIYDEIFVINPRFKEEYKGFGAFDTSILNCCFDDTGEERAKKHKFMEMYHEYSDCSTRMQREKMFFLADEYHEMITYDDSGSCYSDFNFWNISRSAGVIGMFATQSINSFLAKLKDENIVNNFLNQCRNKVCLTTEDRKTAEDVVFMAGKSDRFVSSIIGEYITIQNELHKIYGNYNAFVSDAVFKNTGSSGIIVKEYPYDYDVLAKGEALEPSFILGDSKKLVSNLFQAQPSLFPSMKLFFMNEGKIEDFVKSGTAGQGYQSNYNQIKMGWSDAKSQRNEKHAEFLKSNTRQNEALYSEAEYMGQGNTFAFMIYQRAGKSVAEKVVISPRSFFTDQI